VLALIKAFWQIMLFREGPDSLPDSRPLLFIALIAYALTDCLIVFLSEIGQSEGDLVALPFLVWMLVPAFLDIALLFVCILTAVFYFGCIGRLRQTFTAMLGTSVLLQILSLPSFVLLFFEQFSAMWALSILVLVVMLLWSIALFGHILSRAIDKSFRIGVILAMAYFFVNYQMFQLIPDF
jgi:hypothetical protein